MFRSVAVVVALFIASLASSVVAPAWACGCGAYIPDVAGPAVVDERAFVTWDGHNEDILMSFEVNGGSDKAAWIMPVPSAADVTLGDSAVFGELARLSAPRFEYRDSWWPKLPLPVIGGAAAPAREGAPVDVRAQKRIGPFDVTRLAARDPMALATWLTDHGFPHPPGLDQNLAPYVADGWEIVAVQLAADTPRDTLTGTLQPLRLRFASDKAIYPMRLSRSAPTPQTVDLYVLAAHRMDPTSVPVKGADPTLEFAGRIDPGTVAPSLKPFVNGDTFLTRWSNKIDQPSAITGDYIFTAAAEDTAYQQVIYLERDRGALTGAILIVAFLVAVVAATIGATLWTVRRKNRKVKA